MANLYYVRAETDEGGDFDLIVCASDEAEAWDEWASHYGLCDEDRAVNRWDTIGLGLLIEDTNDVPLGSVDFNVKHLALDGRRYEDVPAPRCDVYVQNPGDTALEVGQWVALEEWGRIQRKAVEDGVKPGEGVAEERV